MTDPDAAVDAVADMAAEAAADAAPDGADQDVSVPGDAAEEPVEAAADVAQEAAATWEGQPWYGCTSAADAPEATVVTAFDLADQYFNPEDKRTIERQVAFPDAAPWDRIELQLDLTCPEDGDCDNWDRFANLTLVEDPGGSSEQTFELLRYITPYNIPMCMRMDVTEFAPQLAGSKTLRSFIDTWVGPTSTGNGHGWRVSARFVFHPASGGTSQAPDQVIPLWKPADVEVGNPDNTIAPQTGTRMIAIPSDVTRAELRVLATGHGQGNRSNCAEFCQLEQDVTVNGQLFSFNPWRGDCSHNPIGPKQAGTWKYGRNGWCPGAVVVPQVFDVTSAVVAGQDNAFTYDIIQPSQVPYDNTCRPGAGDASNTCTGCALSSAAGNCDYNGGNHTTPVEKTSVLLMLYE